MVVVGHKKFWLLGRDLVQYITTQELLVWKFHVKIAAIKIGIWKKIILVEYVHIRCGLDFDNAT